MSVAMSMNAPAQPAPRTIRLAQAPDRMITEARTLGANAVVNVRFTTSMVMQGAAELLATGTAVVIEKNS